MPINLDQLRATAKAHCDGCAHKQGGNGTVTKCDISPRIVRGTPMVTLAFDKCPIDLWDNKPAPYVPPAKAEESTMPMPRDQWPLWTRLVARRQIPADVGVGDTFKRLADIGGIGSAYEKLWKKLGSSCGCSDRRKRWNRMFRY